MMLSRTINRLLAIGLLGLVVLLVYGIAASPLINLHASLDDELQSTTELLERYRGIVSLRTQLEDVVQKLASRRASDQAYLGGNSDALAAAEMQSLIVEAVSKQKGKLRSIQVLPPTQLGEFGRITLRVQMELSYAQLIEVMFELETSHRFFLVENLDVRSAVKSGRVSEQDPVNQLSVSVDLTGLRPRGTKDARS